MRKKGTEFSSANMDGIDMIAIGTANANSLERHRILADETDHRRVINDGCRDTFSIADVADITLSKICKGGPSFDRNFSILRRLCNFQGRVTQARAIGPKRIEADKNLPLAT